EHVIFLIGRRREDDRCGTANTESRQAMSDQRARADRRERLSGQPRRGHARLQNDHRLPCLPRLLRAQSWRAGPSGAETMVLTHATTLMATGGFLPVSSSSASTKIEAS